MTRRLALAAIVAAGMGCGGNGSGSSVPVGPSSVGDGGGGGAGGGAGGGGSGGVGGGGSGGVGGGGGGAGGTGGGGTGGTGGGGAGGTGGGGGGSACDLSAPTPIVTGVVEMLSIAVDADFIYYTTRGSGPGVAAYRVAKSGGPPVALLTLPQDTWSQIAVDDSNIYILERGTNSPAGGIHILSKATGSDHFIPAHSLDCDEPHPSRLAIFAGDVYWMQRDAPGVCASGFEESTDCRRAATRQ